MLLRLAITAAVAAVLAGDISAAEPSAKGPPPCREVGIISVRTGKVLRRLSARDGAYAGYAHGPTPPGSSARWRSPAHASTSSATSARWAAIWSRALKGVAAVRASDGRLTSFAPRGNFFAPMGLAIAGHLVLLGGEEGGGVFHSRTSRPVRWYAFDEVHAAVAITVHRSTAFLGGDSRTNFGGDFNLIAIDVHTARFKR